MMTMLQRPWQRLLRPPTSRAKNHKTFKRQRVRPAVEQLEGRLVLSQTITLVPANDEFGAQIQTVTQFGDSNRITLGILDTGSSPIAVSPDDQATFADALGNPDPIPVKVAGGASADGIGGSITGDVSKPITILTDGLHAASLNIDLTNFIFTTTANFTSSSARVKGIQAFIGTPDGSPNLPTISGTPIFAGGFNSASLSKLAAKIDLINGVDFYGIGVLEPDIHFVASTSTLKPTSTEHIATLALTTLGASNLSNPGNDISSYVNYVSNSVQLNNSTFSVSKQKFLVDTGSELTVISTAEANALHIDLSKPFDTITVSGVGGDQTVNGYVINSLKVGLVGGDVLIFKNVPVFVLDAAPGQIDGILGMNLWNYVDQMLVDPFTRVGTTTIPTLSITWDPSYAGSGAGGGFGFMMLDQQMYGGGHLTLKDLLGGAAGDFQIPSSVQAEHTALPTPTTAPSNGSVELREEALFLGANTSVGAIRMEHGTAPTLQETAQPVTATTSSTSATTVMAQATPLGVDDNTNRSESGEGMVDDNPVRVEEPNSPMQESEMLPPAVMELNTDSSDDSAAFSSPALLAACFDDAATENAPPASVLLQVGDTPADASMLAAIGLVLGSYRFADRDSSGFRMRVAVTRHE
jgi:hypothetical protein